MKGTWLAMVVSFALGGCDSPCEQLCNKQAECGETDDAARCVEECEATELSDGKDGMSDCAALIEDAASCADGADCASYGDECRAELLELDRCG